MGTSVSVALQNFTFSVSFFFESLFLKGILHPREKKVHQYTSYKKNETNLKTTEISCG